MSANKNLGDILIEQGVIDRDVLNRALRLQSRRLGEILVEEDLADPIAIANALKLQARATPQVRRQPRLSVDAAILDDLLQRLDLVEDKLGRDAAQGVSLLPLRQVVESLLLAPVDALFKRVRLVAAKTADDLRKRVMIICEGEGLTVDRALVDDLSDIALHLVRNAVDHGIEDPDVRVKVGKNPEGIVRVSLVAVEGKLILSVTDDGRGIDAERVYDAAASAGIVSKSREELGAEGVFKLLFTPGFSTAAGVSSVSGRGVGLDVVEAAALRMGGGVRVHSSEGSGSTFTVRLPLRYARLSLLPLRVGDEWVALPSPDVASVERSDDTKGAFSSASLFPGRSSFHRFGSLSVVVNGVDGSRWVFDEAGVPEQAMTREASSFAQGTHGVVGSARLANGRQVLVLDLSILSRFAEKV